MRARVCSGPLGDSVSGGKGNAHRSVCCLGAALFGVLVCVREGEAEEVRNNHLSYLNGQIQLVQFSNSPCFPQWRGLCCGFAGAPPVLLPPNK